MTAGLERKLAAIVSIDAAGYSRQSEIDEDTAVREVRALRERIAASSMAHGGRLFNVAGDGFMSEFASVSSAVEFVDEVLSHARVPLRAGLHLGEVMATGDGDLLGHGVNVAARLRALAAPGELIVSGDVHHALRGSHARRLVPRGVVKLDKMDEQITTFSLSSGWRVDAAPPKPAAEREGRTAGASTAPLLRQARQLLANATVLLRRRPAILAVALVVVAAPGLWLWRASQPIDYAIDRIETVAGAAGVERFPSLSPDGSFITYSAASPGHRTTYDLYLLNTAGGEPIQLTNSPEENELATAWSPTGDRIAFVRGDPPWLERRRPCRIFVRAAPAGDERQVGSCEGLTDPSRLSWSPIEDTLLYTDADTIRELNLASGDVTQPFPSEPDVFDFNASYSPDGRRFAFVRYTANYTAHIIVFDKSSGRARTALSGINSQAWIAWAPDGRSVFAAANLSGGRDLRTDLWQVRVDGVGAPRRLGAPDAAFPDMQAGRLAFELNHLSVNIIRLHGDEETPITDGIRHDFDPDFSRDGVLAFTSSQGASWIYLQSPGDEPRRVAQLDMNAPRRIRWSPDGRHLALIGEVDSSQRIFIADSETGRTREVRTPGLTPRSVDWSNDGAAVLFAGADDTGIALWRISTDTGAQPRRIYDYGWIDVIESPEGLFAEAGSSPSAQARPPGVYRLDRPQGPLRLTPDIAAPGGLRWCIFGGRVYFISSSQTATRVYSAPVTGGSVTVIATIDPNVDYGLSVDPRTGDLAYGRTDRTQIDVAIAALREAS
ncbi:MAG: hypothetical protein AB7H66_05255 [Hyphomonadaceae bacterium]